MAAWDFCHLNQDEYFCCPTNPEEWKKVEEKFRTRWSVAHAVGAIKGNKYGSDYYNYKDFFSLVLLALIDAEYRFLWVNVGSSGSLSDAQIFNRSDLREKIEDGSLGLLHLNHYFLLGDDTFALMAWMVKPYNRR